MRVWPLPTNARGASVRQTTVDIHYLHTTANAQPYRSLEMLLIQEVLARARIRELVPVVHQSGGSKRPARLVAAAAARQRERI